MATEEGTTRAPGLTVVGGEGSTVARDSARQARDELRRMHHVAADELIADAIALLSLLEVVGGSDEERTLDAYAVTVAARMVIRTLRDAQKHHREALC